MTSAEFISFAQNMEDVVLSRLLSRVPRGRFIDIGAGHPTIENVTYALYLRGWRGINVEPMATEVAMLRAERPEDETVQAAVGAAEGSITLYEAPTANRGATTSNVERARLYEQEGETFTTFEAPVVTLSSLLARFPPGEVHVVKIDVEGMEPEVLAGADLRTHRPWVLVVESTEPNSPTSTAHLWEHLVLGAGYRSVLFDGLNTFYVRDDLDDVATLLSVPANVFDRWLPPMARDLAAAREYVGALENVLADTRAELAECERRRRLPWRK